MIVKKKIKKSYHPFEKRDAHSLIKKVKAMRKSIIIFDSLLKKLESKGDIVLIGGAIRDMIVFKQKPRDFDLIVMSANENLGDNLDSFIVERNSFGGYRIKIDKLKIDIWSMANHWAFKNSYFDCKIENLKNSVFFNFDAIYVNLGTGEYEAESFNNTIQENKLDIVLNEKWVNLNPSHEINILKALIIRRRFNFKFSERLKNYMAEWFKSKDNYFALLCEARRKHYGDSCLLTDAEIHSESVRFFKKIEYPSDYLNFEALDNANASKLPTGLL